MLGKLHGQMGKMAIEKERAQKLRDLEAAVTSLSREQAALEGKRREVSQQLGVDLCLENEWLPLFIENLSQWQQKADALHAATNDVARLENGLRDLLRRLADGLVVFNYPAPENAEVAGGCIDDLEQRMQRYGQAVDQLNSIRRRIKDEYEPAINQLAERRIVFLQKYSLQAGQEGHLEVWVRQLPEWQRLGDRLSEQRALRDDRARSLSGRVDLLELDRPTLEKRRTAAIEKAGQRDELTRRIAAIERDIEHAKQGHDLADALSVEAEALAALESVRDNKIMAATGAALCDWIRTTAIDRSRPEVFRRARELLLAFTRGMLVLELDDQAEIPRFLARQGDEPARPVDQLSTGERMQLLIAVRLAFVEQDETLKLPLLLDEVLGTSDDARAFAIIQAVREIAASGRQVFYFTAQHDEVGKWKAQLGDGNGYRVFDLVAVRRMEAQAVSPLHIAPVDRVPVPAPEGMDHDAYGERLGILPLDPRIEQLDGVHIWHFLDDVNMIHRLLNLGITTWGQLRELIEYGGVGLVDGNETSLRRAHQLAQVIQAAFECWRLGRGKPVAHLRQFEN